MKEKLMTKNHLNIKLFKLPDLKKNTVQPYVLLMNTQYSNQMLPFLNAGIAGSILQQHKFLSVIIREPSRFCYFFCSYCTDGYCTAFRSNYPNQMFATFQFKTRLSPQDLFSCKIVQGPCAKKAEVGGLDLLGISFGIF